MKSNRRRSACHIIVCALTGLSLSGCGVIKGEEKYPTSTNRELSGDNNIYEKPDSIFGEGGLLGKKKKDDTGTSAVGVNGFLWRAALDTVSFIPLASADPFGGDVLQKLAGDRVPARRCSAITAPRGNGGQVVCRGRGRLWSPMEYRLGAQRRIGPVAEGGGHQLVDL